MVEALLVLGAEVSQRAAGGFTALHTAAGGGDVALVELLLKHGADPAAVAGEEHWTPLHRAAGGNGEPVIPESCHSFGQSRLEAVKTKRWAAGGGVATDRCAP